ncbi:MAG: tRNA (adenosine(37)-N6)-dimethylallyltransferase MiaA [Prevotella sp.]|nr:tRNA (adenosine(37)-N6)-dimethylallyltransferase MiaA [Prevotella sp.]
MIVILGPTASGKTQIATRLAAHIGGEIISADSRQVYRRMDIGTGKDLGEYGDVPYHLIDICEPGTKYNLFQYQQDFHKAYDDIVRRGKEPILCGGTGLYIEAVLKGYQLAPVPENPELRKQLEGKTLQELTEMLTELKRRNGSVMHNTTDVDTSQRAIRAIEIEMGEGNRKSVQPATPVIQSPSVFGVSIDRELRREKISRRLRARLDEGMVEEIQGLLNEGIPPENLIYYGLEYKYVTLYLTGQMSYDDMVSRLEIAIHQFAKRQMTWFRGMERRGISIKWLPAPQTDEEMQETIELIINNS